jgi:hypothetical protein
MLSIHPYLEIRHNKDGTVVSSTCWPQMTLQEIPWYSFLLQDKWTTGLLNLDKRNRPFENFQGPYQASNPEPAISLCSASTALLVPTHDVYLCNNTQYTETDVTHFYSIY